MAKQDDWVRLTVRMPPELYARLQQAVADGPNSMNAEVVARLQQSLEEPVRTAGGVPLTNEGLELMRAIAGDTARMVREFKAEVDRAEHVLLSRADQNARERTNPKPD